MVHAGLLSRDMPVEMRMGTASSEGWLHLLMGLVVSTHSSPIGCEQSSNLRNGCSKIGLIKIWSFIFFPENAK